ncbi:PREDICTED: uncharacterized protein LOC105124148 isoform X2 [Populus euphratica]|uniref:Uncharacterized protein LOC105124148 isoform X2 n=1 Tax=Populus euphratica TaxID=75702 RepID=A0AAJ6U4C9_POPEU|nr:PREDICTED: uncharacterized protein LOC105124148 isoform X2 [Populus euphratica]
MFLNQVNWKPQPTQRKSLRIKATMKTRRRINSMRRISAEMVEISKGQNQIRERQKEVRNFFKEIRKETEKLKRVTDLISEQSAANQLRLDLMFQIVKARADNDSAKDAHLTQTLRELMVKTSIGEKASF